MRQSQLFTKTKKEAPKDEVSLNAQLLIRAGFIDKVMAGVYTYLPLGLRVLGKIESIIREEMNAVGGQEILMPSLQPKENWEQTGRWSAMDDLYKVKDASNREFALGPTHEEIVSPLVKRYIQSYRDLPFGVYQFQNKFRAELRSKSGLLRGREFLMKDLYSFHLTEEDLDRYYKLVTQSYFKIYNRIGIGEQTFFTFASGGSFSKYSHEFQTLCEAGEDTIYICEECKVAINKEIIGDMAGCPECGQKKLKEAKSIEVGNIFKLGTKYSAPFDLKIKDEDRKDVTLTMGCYGIGLGRLMGTIVELFHDKNGIMWPEVVAPFKIHLIALDGTGKEADKLYDELNSKGIEVLYDDREDKTAGEKFADADLIGLPLRFVVSKKTLLKDSVEVKKRNETESKLVLLSAATDTMSKCEIDNIVLKN